MSFDAIMAKKFFALYGHPQTDDPATFFAEWKRRFEGTDAEILTAATDLVIDRHKFHSWPTIGECREAVREVAERAQSRRDLARARALPPPVRREPTPEQKRLSTPCSRKLCRR